MTTHLSTTIKGTLRTYCGAVADQEQTTTSLEAYNCEACRKESDLIDSILDDTMALVDGVFTMHTDKEVVSILMDVIYMNRQPDRFSGDGFNPRPGQMTGTFAIWDNAIGDCSIQVSFSPADEGSIRVTNAFRYKLPSKTANV